MTDPATNEEREVDKCPKCGARYIGSATAKYKQFLCGSTYSMDRNEFAESWQCASSQLAALTAANAQLQAEVERLRRVIKDAVALPHAYKLNSQDGSQQALIDEIVDSLWAAPASPEPRDER